jgi:hypothetical protein
MWYVFIVGFERTFPVIIKIMLAAIKEVAV